MPPRQYAPALSKAAFQNIRPKGSYQHYLQYLGKNRPGWDPSQPGVAQQVKPTPAISGQITYPKLLQFLNPQFETPQQLEERANRMTQTQLKSQQDMLDVEYKRAQDDALRRQLASQASGRAAAAMNAELMGRVGGAYSGAAGEIGGMGGALGAAAAGATASDVAAANTALGNVGAPAVTVGGPVGTPGIAGPTQAGVETYRGATLPAQQLGTSGLAEQFGMAGLIGSQNLRATQEASSAYTSTVREAQANKQGAVRELALGRPQVAAKYLDQLQANQRQAVALASGLIGAGFEQKMTGKEFTEKVKQQGILNKRDQQKFTESQKQWWANYNLQKKTAADAAKVAAEENRINLGRIDASASGARGFLVDNAGNMILDKNNQPIPIYEKPGSTTTTGGLTPYQMTQILPKAQEKVPSLFYGHVFDEKGNRIPANESPDFKVEDPSTWGSDRLKYDRALSRLQQMGVPGAYARQMLSEYYERGDKTGRPVFEPEEKAALIKSIGKPRFNRVARLLVYMYKSNRADDADDWVNRILSGTADLTALGKKRSPINVRASG